MTSLLYCATAASIRLSDSGRLAVAMKQLGSFGGCASDDDVFEELEDSLDWLDNEARMPVRMAVLSVPV